MDAISMAICPPKRPKQSFEWESWWAVSRDNPPWAGNGLIWPSSPKVDPEKVARCIDSYSIYSTRWWFHIFFMFTPTVGEDQPILSNIFQMGLVETTNQLRGFLQKLVIHLETIGCRFTSSRWALNPPWAQLLWVLYLEPKPRSNPGFEHGYN